MSAEIAKLLSRNNFASIPKDQQKLLDRHGVGAVPPAGHRPSLDDVPAHVLSTVTDAYLEKQKRSATIASLTPGCRPTKSGRTSPRHSRGGRQATVSEASDNKSHVSPPASLPRYSHKSSHNGNNSPAGQCTPASPPDGSPPGSSPERFTSWSPSEGGEQEDGREKQEETEMASPPSQTKAQSHIANQTPNQESMAPPPKPTAVTRLAPTFDFPSSGPEEDLEVELPQAQLSTQARTHGTVVPDSSLGTPECRHPTMETPPCAQPSQTVIPGTVVPDPSPPQQVVHDQTRPKRMKPIEFSDFNGTSPTAQSANTPASFQRMISTKPYQAVNSSSTTPSSSIIAASSQNSDAPGAHVASSIKKDMMSMNGHETSGEKHEKEVMDEDKEGGEGATVQEQQVFHETRQGENDQILPSVENETSTHSNGAPFDIYSAAYPSYITEYSGTLLSFVKACICLEHMSKHRSLNHCLWDDFIRAFSAEYLSYVQNIAQPLVASEWYNDREDPPVFEDRVVQKGNLGVILQAYPDEVVQARKYITGSSGQTEAEHSKPGTSHQPAEHAGKTGEAIVLKRRRDSTNSRPQASKARAVSHSTPQPDSARGGSHTPSEPEKGDIYREMPVRRSIGPPTVDPAASTPSNLSDPNRARDSTPKSSPYPSTQASASGYFRRLLKPRSAKDQERFREHIRKRSSGGGSTDSKG